MAYLLVGLVVVSGIAATPPPAAAGPRPVHEYRSKTSVHDAAFLPDGKTVVLGGGFFAGPGEVTFWDAETGRVVRTDKAHRRHVWHVAVSPDGKMIATAGDAGQIKLWDPDGRELADLDAGGSHPGSLAFSPDGRLLAGTADGVLKVWDLAGRKDAGPRAVRTATGNAAAFAPDGKTFAVVWGGDLHLLEAPGWDGLVVVDGIHRQLALPLYSPDGRFLSLGGYDKATDGRTFTTKLWDVKTREVAHVLPRHSIGRAFTPDGRHLLTGGVDGRVRAWDIKTGREVVNWLAATKKDIPVRSLAVSPDGTRLVSCSDDDTARLWDLSRIVPPAERP